jgi:hypothetical protein
LGVAYEEARERCLSPEGETDTYFESYSKESLFQ